MSEIDMSAFEFKEFSNLEKTLGRLALLQITRQVINKSGFLEDFERGVYYGVAEAIGICKERAEEIRNIVYRKFAD